jgi:hypothetical protein
MARRASLASVFPDLTRSPIRNCPPPEPRHFRPGQRIFHAFMIHGNLPLPSAITGVEPQSSAVPWAGKYLRYDQGTVEIFSLQAFQPRRHVRIPARIPAPAPASIPVEKHCAAQAEYGRLAAQAYSPSDAMSQARFCLDGMKKVQRRSRRIRRGNLPAETRGCGRRICSRGRGGPPDFPRRRRPRCIAPCGGVVWLAPIPAGRAMPAMTARRACPEIGA